MIVKAIATAAVWLASTLNGSGSPPKIPSNRWARAGSPTQPRPSEARVIPSWVAEM